MGTEITYCFNCQERVRGEEIGAGRGYRMGAKSCCAICLEGIMAFLSPGEKAELQRQIDARRPAVEAPPQEKPAPRAPAEKPAPAPVRKRPIAFVLAGAAALLVAVTAIVLITRQTPTASPPKAVLQIPEPIAPTVTPPLPPETGPEPLRKARAHARTHPDDLEGQIKLFTKAVWELEGKPEGLAAKKELDALTVRRRESFVPELAQLDRETRGPIEREEFRTALDLWEAAQSRYEAADWTLEVGKKTRAIWDQVDALYKTLKQQAQNVPGDARALRGRIAKWELKQPLEDFDRAFGGALAAAPSTPPARPAAPVAPAPKPEEPAAPLSEEARAYLAQWEKAMALAVARDFAGAVAELERTRHADAAADIAAVRLAADAHAAALQTLATLPRGRNVVLLHPDETGALTTSEGRVMRGGPARVELKTDKGTLIVEHEEIALQSLAELAAPGRAAALLCILGGDLEAARRRAGAATLPGKYWRFRAEVPKPDPAEHSARRIFHAAEIEYRSAETMGNAIAKYKSLAAEHGVSAIVRKNLQYIVRRGESGREHVFFAADFKSGGTFRRSKHDKVGACLTSVEESDYPPDNFVEIQFHAVPETAYKAWILIGGCCAETFQCDWQATHLTAPDPQKSGKKLAVEPGEKAALPFKHSIPNLKRDHAAHAGPNKEPKQPARWEWAAIPLPKFPSGGLKKIRFLTGQKGFSVAAAVISALRPKPPTEPELRDLEKARAAEGPVLPPADPSLVAHWEFDEGGGTSAVDGSASGHEGALSGGTGWGEGRIGGAISFNGANAQVKVADSKDLQIPGDLTIAFWMKKKAEGTDWVRIAGKGDSKARNYGLWEEGGEGKKIMFQQYNAAGQNVISLNSKTGVAKGAWVHVAATVSGKTAAIYINGKLDATAARTGPPATSNDPFTLGSAAMHGTFNGQLDDVRLYNRALTAEEIAALQ